jgi:hypothetical protein
MRFAIAIGLLANTLPAASQSESVNVLPARSERKERMQALLQEPPSGRGALVKKLNRGKKSSLFGRQRVAANQGILKNILASQEGTVECDPASSDADVGLLSCGMGNYCMESQGSNLGGFCVESPMAFDRDLQDGISENYTEPCLCVPPAQYCNESSPYFDYFECDCDEFDVENNTGTLTCKVYENYCFGKYGCNDTCGNANVTVSIDGESYSYSTCYDFFTPYEQKFCYYYSSALDITECAISVDDELCTSCSTSSLIDPDCGEFDCENVGAGSSGNSCDYGFYPPIAYDCFVPEGFVCALCGAGMDITIPDGVVNIPTQPDRTCAELEVAAAAGAITKPQCPLLQPFVTIPCGCMPITPTPAPIEEPTPAPIEEPTPAPEDVPTLPPTDGVSSLLSSKSAMSLVGLSMVLVAYFAD